MITKLTLSFAIFIIAVTCVSSGLCQCASSSFDHDKYFIERVKALDSDTGQVFHAPADKKLMLDNWFNDGIVDSFWTQLYKDNKIDDLYLAIETRDMELDKPGSHYYEVVVVIREDSLFKLCKWPTYMRTPEDSNAVHEGWIRGRPIFYEEIPKDTFQVFWNCFNTIYEPFEMNSFRNPGFSSSWQRMTVISICDNDQSNTFWITYSGFQPPDNLPDLLYFLDLTQKLRPREKCPGLPWDPYWDDVNLRE